MAIGKEMARITMQIMETLLDAADLNDSMAGGLELLVNALGSRSGAI